MKTIVFVIGSAILILISRNSLGSPKSHGFSRFFAWECILAVFLVNVDRWFIDPLAWHQVISWSLLIISLIPLVSGVYALRRRGKPAPIREGDASLLAFEKTTTLVTSGIYHYIRHPLYCSLLLLNWGIFFKSPSIPGLALGITCTVFLIATALADERECLLFFGDAYRIYISRTKRFIPFLF